MTHKITVPLHAIAHGRAGDKGNTSNISVIAYRPEAWPYILAQVTPETVAKAFAHLSPGEITRFELPNLYALNFVIQDALQGGVNSSLGLDRHGKSLSFLLLGDVSVTVPRETLPQNSPYLELTDL